MDRQHEEKRKRQRQHGPGGQDGFGEGADGETDAAARSAAIDASISKVLSRDPEKFVLESKQRGGQ